MQYIYIYFYFTYMGGASTAFGAIGNDTNGAPNAKGGDGEQN